MCEYREIFGVISIQYRRNKYDICKRNKVNINDAINK